jgi:predicted DCC family thiol-disulfide oxidoreductase YuxK
VRFVLRHDRGGRFRFAALQSRFATQTLARHTRDPLDLDTMYLLLDAGTPNERLLNKSDGILGVLRELGGFWRLLALARVLPLALRNRAYDFLARNRYRWFGIYDACPIPPPEVRQRFADLSEDERDVPDVARV